MTSKFGDNAKAYTCTHNEISTRSLKKRDYMFWGVTKMKKWVCRRRGVTEHWL